MKLLKPLLHAKSKPLPQLRFEDQQLSSFSGLLILIPLFKRLNLERRLEACFQSITRSHLYSYGLLSKLLLIHIILGYRQLKDINAYHDDPVVAQVLGQERLPSAPTLSRMLAHIDGASIDQVHELNRQLVLDRLSQLGLRRITLDFDGTVLTTRRHAQGSAIGFNRQKRGHRSYYPLCCHVAQSGQLLDLRHRSGNVHDSAQAIEFVQSCLQAVRAALPGVLIEARFDSAFYTEKLLQQLEQWQVQYTISVPFTCHQGLRQKVHQRRWWWRLRGGQGRVDYFEERWKPKRWKRKGRLIFVRHERPVIRKGPLQLDLFEPRDWDYEYQVVVTNKKEGAAHIARFHQGRGNQEKVLGQLKSEGAMDYVPARRWNANKLYLMVNVIAHNLGRELQMELTPPAARQGRQRAPLWTFEGWEVLRRELIQRAGRLIRPQGRLTLSMSCNQKVQSYFRRFLPSRQFT